MKIKFSVYGLLITVLAGIVLAASCGGGGGGGGGSTGGGGVTGAPIADVSGVTPTTGLYIGADITLDGSNSSDPDGSIISYVWNLGNGSTVSGVNPTYSYVNAGTYTITLTVTDDAGNTDSASVEVTVLDDTPIADAGDSYGPAVAGVDSVTFDGSGSSDNGSISSYEWDFGDGNSDTGDSPSHTYEAPSTPGTYTVTLTVTDDDGKTGSDTTEVRVHQAPVADTGANKSAVEGDTVNFDGSASFDPDSDGSISLYEWDFDGDFTADATGSTASYSWPGAGAYTVGLRVTDNDGATGTDTVEVTVVSSGSNLPPTADAGGPYGPVLSGDSITLDGSGSSDSEGAVTYSWDLDYDGTTHTEVATVVDPPFTNTVVGDYVIHLRVTDTDSAIDTDTTTIRVHEAPIADINDADNPSFVLNGEEFTLSASDSDPDGTADPNVDTIAEYRWDFDNDGTADTTTFVPTVTHTYTIDGTETISLEVLDSSGVVSSSSDTYSLLVHQAVVADIGGPYISVNTTGAENVFQVDDTNIALDGSGSHDPDSVMISAIPAYTWDLDYDTITFDSDLTGAGPTLDITAAPISGTPGSYTMALIVLDPDDPTVSDIATLDYRVNAPPTASFSHDPDAKYDLGVGLGTYDALIDEVITFDASGSSDGDGTVETYEWDFDYDGTTFTADASVSENGINHSYSASGSYTVALRVTDNDGKESSLSTVTIDVPEPGEVNASIE